MFVSCDNGDAGQSLHVHRIFSCSSFVPQCYPLPSPSSSLSTLTIISRNVAIVSGYSLCIVIITLELFQLTDQPTDRSSDRHTVVIKQLLTNINNMYFV